MPRGLLSVLTGVAVLVAAAADSPGWRSLVFEGEADFEDHLIMRDLAVLDMAAGLKTSNHPTWRKVRDARPTAFWIASSMLFSDEPATSIMR